jgi:hypothetical protein
LRVVLRVLVIVLLLVAVTIATMWAALALWYRLPAPEWGRSTAAATVAFLGAATIVALLASRDRNRILACLAFCLAFAAAMTWWGTIRPASIGNWAPDVSRQVTGALDGTRLTLTNVRDFDWHSGSSSTARWTVRTYDLSAVRSLDLFMSYWGSPDIAHVMMSFGFEDGEYLAWSIEVRRGVDGEFSPVADLFKTNPLVIIAATERDVVGVRSNFRGEDVQIYRMRASLEQMRALLMEYVEDANALAVEPQFYNSLTTNCTTTVAKMMRAVGDKVPFDWRLIVNGYLPDYAYDRGALDTALPLSQLKSLAHIDARARASGLSPDFSSAIRVGVPSPNGS